MKANKMPEKIYIHSDNDVMGEVLSQKAEGDIEYTRTDAFIEKAISWLKEQNEMIGVSFQEDFLKRFQDYMKGE